MAAYSEAITYNSIKRYAQGLTDRCAPTLFHYTKPDGFQGIVESGSIWSTNIHYLNDASEFHHGVEIARVRTHLEMGWAKDDEQEAAFEQMLTAIEQLYYRTTFVASFSERGDLLSQWRAYCPRGGFSIGFIGEQIHGANGAFTLGPCIYDRDRQERIINEVVKWCIADFERHRPFEDEVAKDQAIRRAGLNLILLVAEVAPLIKHPSFREECEWRLICNLPLDAVGATDFRSNQSRLIPYLSTSLVTEDDKLPIESVIVGPAPQSTENMLAARSLLYKHGIEPLCLISEVPYRDW